MSTMLFLDTNIIISCKPNSISIQQLKEKSIFVYTSDLVINELIEQNYRKIGKDIKKIDAALKEDTIKKYFNCEQNADKSIIYEENEKKCRDYFKQIFKNNIINKTSDDTMMRVLFERYKYKKPPFSNDGTSSDKGWKDTLIRTNFLEFCNKTQFDCYFFVTKDTAFLNQKSDLIKEFNEKACSKDLQIKSFESLDGMLQFFCHKNDAEKKQEKKFVLEKTMNDEAKNLSNGDNEKIRSIINSITCTKKQYGFDIDYFPNFRFDKVFDNDDVYAFCELCGTELDKYLIFDCIDLKDIFKQCGFNVKTLNKVEYVSYINFVDCWNEIKNNMTYLVASFLEYLKFQLNEMATANSENADADNGELPF